MQLFEKRQRRKAFITQHLSHHSARCGVTVNQEDGLHRHPSASRGDAFFAEQPLEPTTGAEQPVQGALVVNQHVVSCAAAGA
jgi:hypothetical protein